MIFNKKIREIVFLKDFKMEFTNLTQLLAD
jgi:hypothetical protein